MLAVLGGPVGDGQHGSVRRTEFSTSLAAGKADFAESDRSLVTVKGSDAAAESSSSQVAADMWCPWKHRRRSRKPIAAATQLRQSESVGAIGQTFSSLMHGGRQHWIQKYLIFSQR